MSTHVPDLRGLELLVLVARTGSLSSAAAELGISQQAASSRVRTMESLIGSPLLTRTTKGSVLTQHGDLVVQWARAVMDAAEQLDAGLAALKQDRLAHLSIAASLTIAEYLLPSWLVAVRSRQVDVGQPPTDFTMTATNSERVAGLVRGGLVDLGFVEGPEPPEGLRHRLIAVDSLVVVVGRD
ncbi:MAG TPA: LysR family transcriptional regulator, partial [Nocardioides sp.]